MKSENKSMGIVLNPPVAFCLYLVLAGILSGLGRQLAPHSPATAQKSAPFASGEASPIRPALMGYQEFSLAALFFGLLHMGVLVLAASQPGAAPPLVGLYILGVAVTLSLFLG
jgi:hypothetical protein